MKKIYVLSSIFILCMSNEQQAQSHLVQNMTQASSIYFNSKVSEMVRRGFSVISLSQGEAFFDIPLYPFEDLSRSAIYHYAPSRGLIPLREKIVCWHQQQMKATIDPITECLIVPGSKAALHTALVATINPGDEVLLLEPCWVSYADQVRMCHATPVGVPHWQTVYDLEKHITDRTKALIINNPQNPSGKLYTQDELEHVVHLAYKYNIMIISDEVYSLYVPDNQQFISMLDIDQTKQRTIVCNSFSKNFGISGWRIGYIFSNASMIDAMLKVVQHIHTCAPSILQQYVNSYFNAIIMSVTPQIKDIMHKRKIIAHMLDDLGLSYMPGSGTFYFFISIEPSPLNSKQFCTQLLHEDMISTTPGIGCGDSCDRYIRVAIGAEPIEKIQQALTVIKKRIMEN